ncbi:response regulator [Pseudodesulfovibrio pelocollis]|uniref:response regulator n=1 Tax=Pseudodesulfovibrio pelocollis TaxID=3051432 RepID=UPI00255ABE3F|nr:response regulator [Pseudodesulfovibrio sp. SB368]
MTKKILIIDDDPAIVEFLEDFLQDNGFATVSAFDGVQGIDQLRAHKPDLITLDMDMPEKGGVLFYAAMRKDETLRDTPVVVVSGVGPRPPAIGKDVPVITKPIDTDALMGHLSTMLD